MNTLHTRLSGVLVHPTSFPSPYGIGDLGQGAYDFIDFLKASGQSLWQVLPLGPTGFGDSPYQSFSAFAGQSLLISPDDLVDLELITKDDLYPIPEFDAAKVDYGAVLNYKNGLFKKAFQTFHHTPNKFLLEEFDDFCLENKKWLSDYAVFMACKDAHEGKSWQEWDDEMTTPTAKVRLAFETEYKEQIKYYKFIQFLFFREWMKLKKYANEADGYSWWIDRIKMQMKLTDYLRIDHFRGFEAYWSVPADEETAVNGKWKKGPGKKLFEAIQKELGEDLPIWAEDLGVITPEVEELRDEFAFPGMKILQFAFEGLDESDYHPHNLTTTNCICYTGTHDNDTTTGWYQNLPEPQKDKIRRYCNCDGGIISLDFIRMCMGSIAKYAIFPIQDLFMQDSSCRMNTPGSAFANWAYRYEASALTQDRVDWLKSTTELFGRGRSKSL